MTETVPQAEGRLRAEELIEDLDGMKPAECSQFVEAFVCALREAYCFSCGRRQPDSFMGCQCDNDE
jgi:hypothetical protein